MWVSAPNIELLSKREYMHLSMCLCLMLRMCVCVCTVCTYVRMYVPMYTRQYVLWNCRIVKYCMVHTHTAAYPLYGSTARPRGLSKPVEIRTVRFPLVTSATSMRWAPLSTQYNFLVSQSNATPSGDIRSLLNRVLWLLPYAVCRNRCRCVRAFRHTHSNIHLTQILHMYIQ